MASARRKNAVVAGSVVATVAGGVATNRVQGPWWLQLAWFGTAILLAGAAMWLTRRATSVRESSMCDEETAAGEASRLRVSDTGTAKAVAGTAVTGLTAPAGQLPGEVVVERTGDAEASGDSTANSGVHLT
jgi:hypothetical protein